MRTLCGKTTALTVIAAMGMACSDSRLDRDADVVVTGVAKKADGSVLPQQKLVLVKELDVGEALAGLTIVGSTLGFACLAEQPPEICRTARTSTTDATGSFRFQLKGADTQGTLGQASYFNLGTRLAAGSGELDGPSATQRFQVQSEELAVPDVQLWEPQVTVQAGAQSVVTTFTAPSGSAYGSNIHTGISVEDSSRNLVWAQDAAGGDSIDARLFEDFAGGLVATARGDGVGPGSAWFFAFRSAKHAFTGTGGAPVSRGKSCTVHQGMTPQDIAPCPLTDGNLATGFTPVSEPSTSSSSSASGTRPATANNWVRIDLGAEQDLHLVVIRNLWPASIIEGSADGTAWTELHGAQGGTFSVTPVSSRARFIRVRVASESGQISSLSEVSVY